jgi:hypothetical protein
MQVVSRAEIAERDQRIFAMFREGRDAGAISQVVGVARCSVWRALRRGGLMPPYNVRKPRAPRNRRARALEIIAEQNALIETLRVSRDPCPRCGVRQDFGCAHTRGRPA